MSKEITNNDSVIDSRYVIERIEELDNERETQEEVDRPVWDASEDGQELANLRKLADECDGVDDWIYGATLVSEHYFTDYCKEMLDDCGYLPKDLPDWIVLDFEATAKNMKVDYQEVDFDGATYYVR